ncbi:MAG: lipoprotein [Pseudomonadota bacterium]
MVASTAASTSPARRWYSLSVSWEAGVSFGALFIVGSRIHAMSGESISSVATRAQHAASRRGIGGACLALALLAAGCGQKGPLTLPAQKATPAADAASGPSRTPS